MEAWFVDVSGWEPSSLLWEQALSSLPAEEQRNVMKFMFLKDKRLALASRLLQRQLVHQIHGVARPRIHIARTPEGKPYWSRSVRDSGAAPTWNYNVSHHGTIVAIAAHHERLVGVDVMDLAERPKGHEGMVSEGFFRAFVDNFTPVEWQYVRSTMDEDNRYRRFYRLWSLKEAYIKAIGIGLGFHLLRAEFTASTDDEGEWQMKLDGQVAMQWQFRSAIVDTHVISTALGPLIDMHSPETSSILPRGTELASDAAAPSSEPMAQLEWQAKALAQLVPT